MSENQETQSVLENQDESQNQNIAETRNISVLTSSEMESLRWLGPFADYKLIRIRSPLDGSCFFHSVVRSFFLPYMTGTLNGQVFDKFSFIRNFRKSLSVKLASKTNPADPNSLTYYDTLSRGQLRDLSGALPDYSLENMQSELDSNSPVDNIYNEYVSYQINKDIYILDAIKQDVYMTGNDFDILYKNRPSVVLLYLPGHYELMGLQEHNTVRVIFDHSHPFIISIRNRMKELVAFSAQR